MKKNGIFLEKWGHYLLALLCAGVIVFSAFWMKAWSLPGQDGAPAAADQAQRLADAQQETEEMTLCRPVSGEMIRPFSESPVYDAALGLWAVHPALDFQAAAGENVYAMMDGRVEIRKDGLAILGNGEACVLYRGLSSHLAADGQQVRAGDAVGLAGGIVDMEGGETHICVRYLEKGQPVDFSLFIQQ